VEHELLVLGKLLVLSVGSVIAGLAFLAHRRNHSRFMFLVGAAFASTAVGSFVEGFLVEVLAWDLLTAHLVESSFLLAGLAMLAFLLRPRRSPA
jgi:hypothetical protein